MACDIRIASEMRKNENQHRLNSKVGWNPKASTPDRKNKSKRTHIHWKIVDAKTAEQLGIVNMVVPADKLKEAVRQFALELTSKAPVDIKVAKSLINKGSEISLDASIALEGKASA